MNVSRTLSLSVFLLCANILSAQFEKGNIQFGADGAANLVIGDRFALEDWILMPEVSYFFFDDVSFGLSGFYSDRAGLSFAREEYNVGLLTRYYPYQEGSFSLHLENYIGIGEITGSSDSIEELNFNTSLLKLGLGVGVNYHLIPHVALSFSIRVYRDFELDDFNSSTDPMDFRFGLRVNLDTLKE